jgi:glutathione synthase/RimK-type ligase-like ATP-grasp enzyme
MPGNVRDLAVKTAKVFGNYGILHSGIDIVEDRNRVAKVVDINSHETFYSFNSVFGESDYEEGYRISDELAVHMIAERLVA